MTGSITCFQVVSIAACSSLDLATNETKPPRPGVVLVKVLDRGCWPKSDPEGDLMSENELPPSGDTIEDKNCDEGLGSLRGKEVSLEKKDEMNTCSAVALSMKTSKTDRTRPSMWTF